MNESTQKIGAWQGRAQKILEDHNERLFGTMAISYRVKQVTTTTMELLKRSVLDAFSDFRLIIIGTKGDYVCYFDPDSIEIARQHYRKKYPQNTDYELHILPFREWFKANEVLMISDTLETEERKTSDVRAADMNLGHPPVLD